MFLLWSKYVGSNMIFFQVGPMIAPFIVDLKVYGAQVHILQNLLTRYLHDRTFFAHCPSHGAPTTGPTGNLRGDLPAGRSARHLHAGDFKHSASRHHQGLDDNDNNEMLRK